jgi:hypothetical protein
MRRLVAYRFNTARSFRAGTIWNSRIVKSLRGEPQSALRRENA